jgi:hypothetical protein
MIPKKPTERAKEIAKSLHNWSENISETDATLEFLENTGLLTKYGTEVEFAFWYMYIYRSGQYSRVGKPKSRMGGRR